MRDVHIEELFPGLQVVESVEGRPDGVYARWTSGNISGAAWATEARPRLELVRVIGGIARWAFGPAAAVASEAYGREVVQGMAVHHVNGNRFDDRVYNLAVMPRDLHAKLHGYMKHGATWLAEGDPERLRRDLRTICRSLPAADRRAKSIAIARNLPWQVTELLGVAEFDAGIQPAHLLLLPRWAQRYLHLHFAARRALRVLANKASSQRERQQLACFPQLFEFHPVPPPPEGAGGNSSII